ncbi:MAG: DUF5107 domain-containing protein [Planctomycetes bacterium]|nr:DUF5107 domain-containing protein [Planctomycetota bacterium]
MDLPRLVLPDAPADQAPHAVKAWRQGVAIATYLPGEPDRNPLFLEQRVYQGSSGRVYPLPVIDRIAETPVLRTWDAIHLENERVRLMILPELGGRIHIGLDKGNGYDFFYRQNVIKPALVGLAGPWCSGGVEFNWPQHHRPATAMPVAVAVERADDGSVTVWCSDHDPMARMKGMHGVACTTATSRSSRPRWASSPTTPGAPPAPSRSPPAPTTASTTAPAPARWRLTGWPPMTSPGTATSRCPPAT